MRNFKLPTNANSELVFNMLIGKVNINQATHQLLKDDTQFAFEKRGNIQVKGKGEMEMWFVHQSNTRL